MARKNRTPEENARREKIRELLQNSEICEKFQKQKNHSNPKIQVVLCWSCWADSNRRPHPYQNRKIYCILLCLAVIFEFYTISCVFYAFPPKSPLCTVP